MCSYYRKGYFRCCTSTSNVVPNTFDLATLLPETAAVDLRRKERREVWRFFGLDVISNECEESKLLEACCRRLWTHVSTAGEVSHIPNVLHPAVSTVVTALRKNSLADSAFRSVRI